jgi:uncharacterized membrane protein YeaQ/YmgE (transglycosylase-associated protein family)
VTGLGPIEWMIVGLIAGAIAGALVPGRQRYGCLGTMLIGIVGGLLGGFLWVEVFNQSPTTGWLGAIVVAVLGAMLVILALGALNRD